METQSFCVDRKVRNKYFLSFNYFLLLFLGSSFAVWKASSKFNPIPKFNYFIFAVNNCSEFIVTREDNVQTNLVSGNYNTVWQQVNNPNFKCRKCSSSYIVYRDWESSCGGYEDTHYKCVDCGFDWWVEGIDS